MPPQTRTSCQPLFYPWKPVDMPPSSLHTVPPARGKKCLLNGLLMPLSILFILLILLVFKLIFFMPRYFLVFYFHNSQSHLSVSHTTISWKHVVRFPDRGLSQPDRIEY